MGETWGQTERFPDFSDIFFAPWRAWPESLLFKFRIT